MIDVVTFLGITNGDGEIEPHATAFYVVVPFRDRPAQGRGYLVTAKHNIEKAAGRPLFVSINPGFLEKHEKRHWLALPHDLRWHLCPDEEEADVAVADWRPSEEYSQSYRGVLLHTFVEFQTRIGLGIGPGTEVCIVGLFPFHHGSVHHRPLVRSGTIALFPADRVTTRSGDMEAFIVESRSLGGLSGSPVFALYVGDFPQIWHPLLGIAHGHWDYERSQLKEKAEAAVNSGMTVVSPASKISQILFSDELLNARSGFNCMTLDEIPSDPTSLRS